MTIFTKIINGEIPCYKIYEDEYTFAFLSKDQITLGHTLIIPKIEVDHFIDLQEPYYSAVFQNAKIIARAIQDATQCKRIGTMISGWDVPHFHYHLVPMFDHKDLDSKKAKEKKHEKNTQIQQKIISHIKFQ